MIPQLLRRFVRVVITVAVAGLLLASGDNRLWAAPGLCVGPVCGDGFARSSTYPWLLRLRVNDQQGRHERLAIDCRSGALTPVAGPVERGYARAVAQRACRFTSEASA